MCTLDPYSYGCGVIDCFNEMLQAEVKHFALGHPEDFPEARDRFIAFSEKICEKYKTKFYVEDELLTTDLFPVSMTKGKYLIVYYREDVQLKEYLRLKQTKQHLTKEGCYEKEARKQIAIDFGRLLSYTDTAILDKINANTDKEPF